MATLSTLMERCHDDAWHDNCPCISWHHWNNLKWAYWLFIRMLVITVISSSSRLKRRSRPWMDRGRCPIIVSNSICTSAHAHWIFNPWPQYCNFLQQNPASRKCRQRFSLSWKLLMALVSWNLDNVTHLQCALWWICFFPCGVTVKTCHEWL